MHNQNDEEDVQLLRSRLETAERRLEAYERRQLRFEVSQKGGVSVYGLGKYPVTLYYEQWIKLLDVVDELRAYLEEKKPHLKLKEQNR